MGMNVIQPVTILDGNQYLVQGPADKTGQATSFDNVYNRSCGDETLDEIFEDVSQEYGVNVNLLKAVAQAESGFDVNATSSCGAMGIMQLMPSTAESYGVEDPYDARQSITGGAKLLSMFHLHLQAIMPDVVRFRSMAVFLHMMRRLIT